MHNIDIIYESIYQKITKPKTKNFFIIFWTNTEKMEDEDYKYEVLQQIKYYLKYKVQGSLIDTSNFEYAIPPRVQEWASKEIFPPVAKAGLRYVAVLIPSDFYAQLSIDQYINEDKENLLEFHYFGEMTLAKTWLDTKIN